MGPLIILIQAGLASLLFRVTITASAAFFLSFPTQKMILTAFGILQQGFHRTFGIHTVEGDWLF